MSDLHMITRYIRAERKPLHPAAWFMYGFLAAFIVTNLLNH